ncbi:hypothetical protein CBR_g12051 [Chara braunii]|uniref:Uncharacterized protein n=1 Tax=Chara braunii TaxID=69332 RepID=A0A388KR08_CHABU|nr:hypothetical protein CBR_g12051 [Chara braunii]|eukprot:GBG72476.1 hypothetical protein CBR_g12051 [Chara braunii]
MPARGRRGRYNRIDDVQRRKIIESIFVEGKTFAETAVRYGFPRSTVHKRSRLMTQETTKRRGGNVKSRVCREELGGQGNLIDAINRGLLRITAKDGLER